MPTSKVERGLDEQDPPLIDTGEPVQSGTGSPPILPELKSLWAINIFGAEFGDPFNTLASGGIHTNPVDMVHSYVSKMWALLEKHNREERVWNRIKTIYRSKYIFLNGKMGHAYSRYLQTEIRTPHPELHNFNGYFSVWVGNIFTRVEN